MSGRPKRHYESLARDRIRAFTAIARELGDEHEIVKMMAELAWGRSDAERGPDQNTLRDVVWEAAFLEGSFDILNKWALLHDREAQRVMLKIWHNR